MQPDHQSPTISLLLKANTENMYLQPFLSVPHRLTKMSTNTPRHLLRQESQTLTSTLDEQWSAGMSTKILILLSSLVGCHLVLSHFALRLLRLLRLPLKCKLVQAATWRPRRLRPSSHPIQPQRCRPSSRRHRVVTPSPAQGRHRQRERSAPNT